MFNALNEPQGGCPQTAVLFIDEWCSTRTVQLLLMTLFHIFMYGPLLIRGGPKSRDKRTFHSPFDPYDEIIPKKPILKHPPSFFI